MKDIERTNALLANRTATDMLVSTELLISMLFANTRSQLTPNQMVLIGHDGEVSIVGHQLEMMLGLTEDEANLLVEQYLGA